MTTLFPLTQIKLTDDSESDPIHTLACRAAGRNPDDPEAAVSRVDDQSAIAAVRAAALTVPGVRVPACDEADNVDVGSIYAVDLGQPEYVALVHVHDGVAERL